MKARSIDNNLMRQIQAARQLWPDFITLGDWKFMSINTGKIHDLSAADLNQIKRIEEESLFVI